MFLRTTSQVNLSFINILIKPLDMLYVVCTPKMSLFTIFLILFSKGHVFFYADFFIVEHKNHLVK